jgi:Bacterial membrane protein YfhO
LPSKAVAMISAAWVLALVTAAIVWMPAGVAARESARWGLPEARRVSWAVHPLRLPELVSSVPFDDLPLSERGRRLLFDEPRRPFLKSLYLGLASVGLVLAGLLRGPAPTPRSPWLITGAGCLLVSLGLHTPVYAAIVGLVPPLAMLRYPSKAMVGVALSWAVLCAVGLETQRRGLLPVGRLSWRLGVAGVVAALLVVGGLGALLLVHPGTLSSLEVVADLTVGPPGAELGPRLLGSALAGILVVSCVASRAGATSLGHLVAAATVVLDLALSTRGINRHAPRSLIAFRPPLVDALKTHDHTRVYVYDYGQSPGGKSRRYLGRDFALMAAAGGSDLLMHELAVYEYLPPPSAGRWGIEGSYDMDLRGLQPQLLRDLTDLLRDLEGSPLHLRLLRLGAVSRVVALHTANLGDLMPVREVPSLLPEPIKVFAVPNPQPRTYAVGRAIMRSGPDEIRALLQPDFDPANEVVLSGFGERVTADSFTGSSTIISMRPDQVVIDAALSRAGWVVLVDAYDPGWRVTVDGRSAPLFRANAVFRAVAVASGRHRIEMRYRPRAVATGLILSCGGLAIVLSLLAASAFRRRTAW